MIQSGMAENLQNKKRHHFVPITYTIDRKRFSVELLFPIDRHHIGTLQKDWAVLQSNALPECLCIAVRGHKGWCKDVADAVPYTLAVTIEALNEELQIYEPLRVSIQELQTEIDEMEVELPI